MKHHLSKRIVSILLAVMMLISLLPPAAFPVLAVEESDIYGKDPYYEHGYFLGGIGQWEGGTWIREVYDWDDMDQVFEMLDSSSMNSYGYVTVKLMADLSMTAQVVADGARNMKEYSIEYGLNNVVFDFNGHTLSATDDIFTTTNPEYPLESFIGLYIGGKNVLTFTDSVGGGGIHFYSSRAIDSNVQTLDNHFHVNYPTINGGYFEGQMGFTGLTYTYSDGNSALNSRPASKIILETVMFIGVGGDGIVRHRPYPRKWLCSRYSPFSKATNSHICRFGESKYSL